MSVPSGNSININMYMAITYLENVSNNMNLVALVTFGYKHQPIRLVITY